MADYIEARALTLAQLFNGDFRLELPWFQRAYAWRTEQAGRLFSDVFRKAQEDVKGYSLGTIRLAGQNGERVAMLVDGHQRMMTLTIIFALLRDLAARDGLPIADVYNEFIFAPERSDRAGGAILISQASVAEFVRDFVQAPGSTLIEPEGDLSELSHPARNVLENRNHLLALLEDLTPEERQQFAEFLLDRCWIVMTKVEDEDEAWAMLANEENTTLDFHVGDRAKISLLSVMPISDQHEASAIWELWQSRLGNDGLTELLGHLRHLVTRKRSNRPIERDLAERQRLDRHGLSFMKDMFAIQAGHLVAIKQRSITSSPLSPGAQSRLDTLSWMDHPNWVLPLLAALGSRRRYDDRSMETLVHLLDRLAWLLKIAATDIPAQESRFIRVAEEVRAGKPVAEIAALRIERKLSDEASKRLAEKNFYLKGCRNGVLRRLSLIAGHLHGPVDGVEVTVEHVLPHKADSNPDWRRTVTPAEIAQHVNRLGNLVFLTQADNDKAGAHFFTVKKPILSASGFALARAAAAEAQWNVATIERRTQAAIKTLLDDVDRIPGR
jgi:hypothetical protein